MTSQEGSNTTSFDLKDLQAPFDPADIEWRVQRSGIKKDSGWVQVVAYIDNRAVMRRLDDVVGPANWKDEYDTSPVGGVLCGISIRIGDEWVTKWDGADKTDIEPIKGGLSNAEKRAAVKWGIGRYLYRLESAYVPVSLSTGDNYIAIKERKEDREPKIKGYWNAPKLPAWARPISVDEPKQPSAASIITGTNEPKEPTTDEPPATTGQILKIKTLWVAAGGDADKRDEWMKQIITEAQANQAIKQLQAKKEAREEKTDDRD